MESFPKPSSATTLLVTLLTLGLVIDLSSAQDPRENPSKFFDDRLANYDRLRKPGPVSEPVVVTLSMYIMKIEDIDLHSETMTLNAYLRYEYLDERLKHDSPQPVVTTDLATIQRLWEPDVFVENAQEMTMHDFPVPNVFVKIEPGGSVKMSRRLQLKVHCEENLDSFPMDTVTCTVSFSTYGNTEETIKLKGFDKNGLNTLFDIADQVVPVGYLYKGLTVEEQPIRFASGSYSVVKVHVNFERLRGGYVVTIFLPCIGFVLLSYLSLFVDTREVGTKLVFNALLLATTCYLTNSQHFDAPRVSRVTAMDYFTGTTSFILFWVMAASVFLDNFNGPDAKLPFFSGPVELWTWRVDMLTKYGIPLFYIVFQVIFWITYLS